MLVVVGGLAFASALPFYLKFVALFSSLGRVREPSNFWQVMLHFGGLLAIVIVGLTALLCVGARGGWRLWLQPLLPVIGIALVLALAAVVRRPSASDDGLQGGDLVIVALVVVLTLLLAAEAWSRGNTLRGPVPLGGARRLLIMAVGLTAVVSAAVGEPVFGLGIMVAGAGAFAYFFLPGTATRMVGLMVAAGAGVVAALEVVYLVDNLDGGLSYRMNTVFKFYNQTWVLLALSGAALFAWMLARLQSDSAPEGHRGNPRLSAVSAAPGIVLTGSGETPSAGGDAGVPTLAPVRLSSLPSVGWSKVGMVVVSLVVAASACYPLTATPIRLDNRFPGTPHTLNAYEWMDYATISNNGPLCRDAPTPWRSMSFADDHAAIDWFNAEVHGSPVIAEMSYAQPYNCFPSDISISTGLPTILGWYNHESQQRYTDDLGPRLDDVETLYDSTDTSQKQDILRRYGVEYVVVGTLERDLLQNGRPAVDPAGLAEFDDMVGTSLEVAFQQGGTTVYRVLPAASNQP